MAVNTSFKTSTSTNYQTMLDDLVAFVTNDQIDTVAVNVGGTGYSVGDIVTLSGGTVTGGIAATFRVTAESAGVVTGLEVWNAGSYSANTGATAIATTGGNADLTVDVTYQTPWTQNRAITNRGLVGATIVAPGSGYVVSEVLTGVSGTGTKYTLTVDSVDGGGAITAFTITTRGNYTVDPTNPDTTTASASGTGATFTTVMSGQTSGDQREVLLQGIGSGTDEIYVGIRTYEDSGENAQNWELAGMTGHDLALPYEQQPNLSPGRFDGTVGGAYVPLATTTVTWWINMTGRRIIFVGKVSTAYMSMYLGFYSPFGTGTEIPYPILIGGCVGQPDTRFSSSRLAFNSICWPVGKANTVSVLDDGDIDNGPLMIRTADGNWRSVMNAHEASNSESISSVFNLRGLWPPGRMAPNTSLDTGNDQWIPTDALDFEEFSRNSSAVATNLDLLPTPNSGTDLSPLYPQVIYQVGTTSAPVGEVIFGELEGVKWAPIHQTAVVAEDTVTVDNIQHRIFQSGGNTNDWQFFAMEER